MNIDMLFTWLFSWQSSFWLIAIYSIIFVMRRFVEVVASAVKEQKWWYDLLLPIAPVLAGFGLGFIKSLPYPTGIESNGAHALFGITMGFLSSKGYRIIIAFLKQRVPNIAAENADDPTT